MKKCIVCGETGLFLKLDEQGRCTACAKDLSKVLTVDNDKLVDMLVSQSPEQIRKVQGSINAQEAINQRQFKNFETILATYQKAKEKENQGDAETALEIYLSLIPLRPEGTDYYTRPCILLEKQKRYEEAIKICNLAIEEISQKHFHADKTEFEARRTRLVKKSMQ